jgi:hypothetical protein
MDIKSILLTMALVLTLFTGTVKSEDRGLPVIEEHVNEIWIIRTQDQDTGNVSEYGRVVFIREGNVLATRLLLDEMVWAINSEAKIQLSWRDYWTAERIVTTDEFADIILPYDPTQVEQRGQWWCMWRNMRDLKCPD